ncbi:precorrin-3B C(17)-methyltransferase [Herbaspirillum autotrophicum]|uniref:precorrin-3B C(17)-methyltransferase n=1 Tax=Herbaspirillum autotrophicum TaxID=180195 RepID=UPI00067A8FF4|nr:precorrin-3B C(17)-methyltransferase [Herbaspirillum autotrophicum]
MRGVLNLVSVGPGFDDLIAPRAIAALRDSEVIVAYELYLRWIGEHLAGKEIHTPPLTQERERALLAIEQARAGKRVSLISSGDIGIYAMAALAFDDMREDDTYAVNVIPGVTSANACASLLGSPLSHDFATLSLSNLLCPWEWIENRASHIAQADLACVLYNVQSAGRQEGVYKILNIMLQSKAPHTLCGVVKNAYRPGQQVSIHRLDELPALQFDMLTSIVIGNRFTQRKRDWIFTPRGYNNWTNEATPAALLDDSAHLPQEAVWVFAGTSDGNALAAQLAAQGHPVVVSTATEYGGAVALKDCPGVTVWSGRQGVEARKQVLQRTRARAIVDATHPYATLMSQQLMALSASLELPYVRYERASAVQADDHAGDICNSMDEAARLAIAGSQRIFLATGSKDLAGFLHAPGAAEKMWFVRVTPEPEFIQRAIDLGIPRSHICAMQGPFSQGFNEALWRDWNIDCVVTKDSGVAGGYRAKADAAQALGIRMLTVRRPVLEYPLQAADFEQVSRQVQAWMPACVSAPMST